MLELLAGAQKPAHAAYKPTLEAIRTLHEHCTDAHDSEGRLRTITDSDDFICRTLFNQPSPDSEASLNQVSGACADLASTPSAPSSLTTDVIAAAAKHVQESERGFVDDLFRLVVAALDPRYETWSDIQGHPDASGSVHAYIRSPEFFLEFGSIQVEKAAASLQIELTSDDVARYARFVADNYKAPACLMADILKRIVIDGCNLSKKNRANWWWDAHILFCVGPNHRIGDRKPLLVTSDKDMLRAARAAELTDSVATFSWYSTMLGLQTTK